MTPDQRRLVLSLAITPTGGPDLSHADFLRQFGASDGRQLGLDLLRDAVARKDGVDAEMALIVGAAFGGPTPEHLAPLIVLASADWHVTHEDVVTALGRLRSPEAVDVLYAATQWVPEYLEFDEDRMLARKAIRALGSIPGEAAERALQRVVGSADDILRRRAEEQLERRRSS